MGSASSWNRVRVERGIYLLPNGKYEVSARRAGRLWSRTIGPDLALARSEREALVASVEAGLAAASIRHGCGLVACAFRGQGRRERAPRADARVTPLPPRASSAARARCPTDECADGRRRRQAARPH
jgi:hypothetical protein